MVRNVAGGDTVFARRRVSSDAVFSDVSLPDACDSTREQS